MLASCTADDEILTGTAGDVTVITPTLQIGVSELTMSAVSRAAEPMSPDLEKYVRTIAIFEFDNEGLHDKRATNYHFVDFLKGTVDGKTGVGMVHKTEFGIVETELSGMAFEAHDKGKLCLVANVTEEQVNEFYDKYREPGQSHGRITFDRFKDWALPFEYEQATEGSYDETAAGHVKTMYMFGYFEGNIDPANADTIRVDLGRLASRLDITVINETGSDIQKRLGYHFDNVCSSAYFFPIKQSMPPTIGAGITRTVICSGLKTDENGDLIKDENGNYVVDPVENAKTEVPAKFEDKKSHTRYFYVAAHSAKDFNDATKLHLFYNHRIISNDTLETVPNSVQIPLCNVHPSQADNVPNGYSLSRNTRYHFTIRLKKSESSPAMARSAASGQHPGEVTYGQHPGEVIVYLP